MRQMLHLRNPSNYRVFEEGTFVVGKHLKSGYECNVSFNESQTAADKRGGWRIMTLQSGGGKLPRKSFRCWGKFLIALIWNSRNRFLAMYRNSIILVCPCRQGNPKEIYFLNIDFTYYTWRFYIRITFTQDENLTTTRPCNKNLLKLKVL